MKKTAIFLNLLFIFISATHSQTDNYVETVLKSNQGHSDAITDFALSTNNKFLATSSEDKSIIIWDFKIEKEIKTLLGHTNKVSCIDISSDNNLIASGETGKEQDQKYVVKIWDIQSGKEIKTIKADVGKIKMVKFINDNKSLIVGGSFEIKYFDIETGSLMKDYIGNKDENLNITISNNRKFIAINTSNKILIWDINKREILKTIENTATNFTSIQLDFSGNNIVAGCQDNTIRIYNTISGEQIKEIANHRYPIISVALDNVNKYIASSDSKSEAFKILDFTNGEELKNIDAHKGRVGIIKFSTNNNYLLTSGSWDKTIKVWDINTGELQKTFTGIEKYIYQEAYIDSNKYFAVGKNGNRAYINYMTKFIDNKEYKDADGGLSCITLSPDKKFIAYGTSKNSSSIISAITGKNLHEFKNQKNWIRQVRFSYDNTMLAVSSYQQLKIYDTKTGTELLSIDQKFEVPYYIAFSKNSKQISVGLRNAAIIFDVKTGAELKKFKFKNLIHSIDFSNNGQYIAFGEGDDSKEGKFSAYIFNIETGKLEKTLKEHTQQITNVKFNNNDKILATSGNRVIKLWDTETEKELTTINAHDRWINDIEFNANNTQLISTSQDGTIKIWDLKTNKLLLTEIGLKDSQNWISYTPDGRFNGTEAGIKSFYFVKDLEIIPLENMYEQYFTPKLTADIVAQENDTTINILKISDLPDVAITKPSNQEPMFRGAIETLLSTSEKTTELSTEITDMGGGIDEIRVYQNNKLIITNKININNKGEKITKNYTIDLSKGLNTIEIAAYNNQGTKKSKIVGVEYTGNEFSTPNLYVFSIGINTYKKPSYNLNYALADATAFTQELTKNSNTIFKNTEIVTLTNEKACKDSILATFEKIAEKTQQNDVFVFYYAGHGSMSPAQTDSKSEFYLIPWEITNLYSNEMLKNSGISASKLREISEQIKAEKQLFVLDACQSGGAIEQLASRGSEEEKAISQLAHSTGTYFITASGSQQLAGEFGELGHGVFTYAILEAFKNNTILTDNKLTVKELTYYVEDQVPILSEKYKGNPQYPTSYGFGQDFPLIFINNKWARYKKSV